MKASKLKPYLVFATLGTCLLALPAEANSGWGGHNAGASALTSSRSNSHANSSAEAAGGNSGAKVNFNQRFQLPASTSANIASGNVAVICPIITAKSKAKQIGWGGYSDSKVGVDPATVNGVCVFYHRAMQSGLSSDWDNFINYAIKADPLVSEVISDIPTQGDLAAE